MTEQTPNTSRYDWFQGAGGSYDAGVSPSGRVLRRIFLLLVLGSLAFGLSAASYLLEPNGAMGYAAAFVLMACFIILFTWIASNFWLTVVGVAVMVWRNRHSANTTPVGASALLSLDGDADCAPRTAIALPIYNEDVSRVMAGVQAMMKSLEETGDLEFFDFFILSDSTDPDIWLCEEMAWLELVSHRPFRDRIFYRRRQRNDERKSGNIRQFLENWGHNYRYMVVLDADSVIAGRTFVEMVRRMEADPELGLLQSWPRVTGGRTLFSRMHQYAAGLYGRILAYGMAAIINPQANYWGHNAIIRVDAFMQCCGLPFLPGKAPLGGEILSHDFVEAALLVRRGWKVEIAPDMVDSFEEGPPNIVQHLVRDQRWCQGNMQHIKLLFARGLHPVTRVNLLTGILAYLSSPIWSLFVIVACVMAMADETVFSAGMVLVHAETGGWAVRTDTLEAAMLATLLGMTVAFILAPKFIGTLYCLWEGSERPLSLVRNVVLETVLSILSAPTVMVRHSVFLCRLFLGRGVKWNPQQRDASRLRWSEATRAFLPQTILASGIIVSAIVWPSVVHLWLSPILMGLVLSIPFAVWTGSEARPDSQLLTTEVERYPPGILKDVVHARTRFRARLDRLDPVKRVLDQPIANQLRLFFLSSEPDGAQPETVEDGLLALARSDPGALTRKQKEALVNCPSALRRLHIERFAALSEG